MKNITILTAICAIATTRMSARFTVGSEAEVARAMAIQILDANGEHPEAQFAIALPEEYLMI